MAKILLVEDDNNLREIYGERLLAEGYEIVSARDGEEALSVAITEKPDLIISDVMMPKISGFDMLDILRQTPETKDVKIIMMTALSQAEDKARADMLGANKYLVKSQVTLEDVARVVHDILEESKPEQATETPAEVTNQIVAEPTSQPVVAAPTDDSSSSQSQQPDDSTQASTDDAIVTDDDTQITDTNEQNEPNTPSPAEPAVDESNNTVGQQPQSNQIDQAPTEAIIQEPIQQTTEQNQPQPKDLDQAPLEDPAQPQQSQIEQPPKIIDNLEQNIQEAQDQPQSDIELPIVAEPTPQAINQPTEDTQQQPTEPAEQPPQTSSNLEQANPESQNQPPQNSERDLATEPIQQVSEQDQPQPIIEQPLATEPTPEATNLPAEDTPQPQAEQEPTVQEEQPQAANIAPQALPVNPIAQNIADLPAQETPQTTPERPMVNSGDAEPAADELTEVTNQIEDFIKNSVTPISEHQEPLTQPSDNINDANNQQEQTQETQPEQTTQDNSLTNTVNQQPTETSISEPSTETTPSQETPQAEPPEQPIATPEVIDATMPYQNTNQPSEPNTPEAPQDSTIPPVIPVEPTEDNQNDETRNPEPASVRKKVISPMHGGDSFGTPDINKLYQEEMAKEAEENGLQNPVANSIISASTNPISVGSTNAELPQLETIDASQIPGISTDGTAPIGVVTPTALPEHPVQAEETPQIHEDPNNPNNIAL